MDDLTSCYFCGTAVEAPVREYPVVPTDLGGGDGPTVTLCPTCRRKHRNVLDAALSALDAGASVDPDADRTARSDSEGPGGPDASVATDRGVDPDSGGRPTTDPDGDEAGSVPGEDGETSARGDDGETDPSARGDDGETDPSARGDDGETDPSARGDDGETDPSARGDDEATDPGEGSAPDAGSGLEDPATFSSEAENGDGSDGSGPDEDERIFTSSTPAGGGVGDLDPDESVGENALEDDAGDAPDVDLGSPPHSKVVRQLQNREFPVDREEIVTVASGAYGLSQDEAQEALDALVAQGVLREAGEGRLDRGEG